MTENKIKLLRKSIPLTLKELATKTNKDLELKYKLLREDITEDDPKFTSLKKIKVTDSQLSLYENGKRTPRHSIIWRALADVFDVSLPYLLGFSEIKDEAVRNKQREITSDFHKFLSTKDQKVKDDFFELNYIMNQSDLKKFEITLREFLGDEKFDTFKNQYTIPIGSQKNEKNFLNILETLLPLMSGNNEKDSQLMLNFIQLNRTNQSKALEQVKNLLIVQAATEHHKSKNT